MEVVWLPECQQWAFEVHPEVCFWALNEERSMTHNKKTDPCRNDRLNLLAGITDSISFAPNSPTSSDFWTANLRESGRTICWTRRRQHGLRCGGTGVEHVESANRSAMRKG